MMEHNHSSWTFSHRDFRTILRVWIFFVQSLIFIMGQMTEWGSYENEHVKVYLLIISNDENKVTSSHTKQSSKHLWHFFVRDRAERNIFTFFLPCWYYYSWNMAFCKQNATESSHRKNCLVTFVNFLCELWQSFHYIPRCPNWSTD